ncbi:MAG: tRNA 2-thiouridine(34) synthase MnmA [Nanoarchaeota archaeon]
MKKQKTILLGMSGGVDSSVAALILKKQGYNVIGVFLKVYSNAKNKFTGECLYLDELKIAKKISALLDIPLIFLDFEKEYKKNILKPMLKSYSLGKTPNPDIACNKIIKFPILWKIAKKYNADYIATGHYAKIKKTLQGYKLLAGEDKSKDQSYFLSDLSQKDLSHTIFPLGNLKKQNVRKIAKQNKFPNWNKHGTTGICFIGEQNMQKFLKRKIREKPGIVKTPEGKVIGTHKGIFFYTIGQKTGTHIGIEIKKPINLSQKRFYIAEKKLKSNVLIVAPESHPSLAKKQVFLKNLHFINPKEKIPPHLKARIRHLGELHDGALKKSKKYIFIFSKLVEAIAEGQYIVLYHKNQLIANAEIKL